MPSPDPKQSSDGSEPRLPHRIGVTGGSGFLGREIIRQAVARGSVVIGFSRQKQTKIPGVDRLELYGPGMSVEGLDAVVHLAGESIFGLWTPNKRHAILHSRLEGTRWVVEAISRAQYGPKHLISASGISIYGDRKDQILTESVPPSESGFLSEVSQAWEHEAHLAEAHGIRVVTIRIAPVLGPGKGTLGIMAPVFKMGLGGKVGSGQQWMSWIHLHDIAALFLHALADPSLNGAVNGVAPNPVRNEEFTKVLGEILHRSTPLAVPAVLLKLLPGKESSLVLDSIRAKPEKALESGFNFRFPNLVEALVDALSGSHEPRH